MAFKEVFDENDIDCLSHTVTEYMLGQSAKLVVLAIWVKSQPRRI